VCRFDFAKPSIAGYKVALTGEGDECWRLSWYKVIIVGAFDDTGIKRPLIRRAYLRRRIAAVQQRKSRGQAAVGAKRVAMLRLFGFKATFYRRHVEKIVICPVRGFTAQSRTGQLWHPQSSLYVGRG